MLVLATRTCYALVNEDPSNTIEANSMDMVRQQDPLIAGDLSTVVLHLPSCHCSTHPSILCIVYASLARGGRKTSTYQKSLSILRNFATAFSGTELPSHSQHFSQVTRCITFLSVSGSNG